MTRSQLQQGPATDHYHDTLGVNQDSGGGGVSVDNGTDPPAAVTTLVAPGAVIAGDSAVLSLNHTIGPFRVDFDTPGLNDPEPGGAFLVDIPAGTFITRVFGMIRTLFDVSGSHRFWVSIALANDSDYWTAANLDVGSPNSEAAGSAAEGLLIEAEGYSSVANRDNRALFASTAWHLKAHSDATAQGSIDIYAVISVPAS